LSCRLYSAAHPRVERSVGALATASTSYLTDAASVVVGFIGDDVVVNDTRLGKGSASLTGFVRALRDKQIEKITFHRGVTRDDIKTFIDELARRGSRTNVADRVAQRGIRRIVVGKLAVEDTPQDDIGIEAARRI